MRPRRPERRAPRAATERSAPRTALGSPAAGACFPSAGRPRLPAGAAVPQEPRTTAAGPPRTAWHRARAAAAGAAAAGGPAAGAPQRTAAGAAGGSVAGRTGSDAVAGGAAARRAAAGPAAAVHPSPGRPTPEPGRRPAVVPVRTTAGRAAGPGPPTDRDPTARPRTHRVAGAPAARPERGGPRRRGGAT